MSEIPYDNIPYDDMDIYKGEGRFLIIPFIKHMSGAYVEGEEVINVEDLYLKLRSTY